MGFVLCQWLISKHSPVSWCDGWGWKLENTYDSQLCGATKRVGHMHFELYIRCWELCYGKMIAVFVGGMPGTVTWLSSISPGEKQWESTERQDCKDNPWKVTFLSTLFLCSSYKIRESCLTLQFRASHFPAPSCSHVCVAQILLWWLDFYLFLSRDSWYQQGYLALRIVLNTANSSWPLYVYTSSVSEGRRCLCSLGLYTKHLFTHIVQNEKTNKTSKGNRVKRISDGFYRISCPISGSLILLLKQMCVIVVRSTIDLSCYTLICVFVCFSPAWAGGQDLHSGCVVGGQACWELLWAFSWRQHMRWLIALQALLFCACDTPCLGNLLVAFPPFLLTLQWDTDKNNRVPWLSAKAFVFFSFFFSSTSKLWATVERW